MIMIDLIMVVHKHATWNQSSNELGIVQKRKIEQKVKTVYRGGLYKNSHSQLELQAGLQVSYNFTFLVSSNWSTKGGVSSMC